MNIFPVTAFSLDLSRMGATCSSLKSATLKGTSRVEVTAVQLQGEGRGLQGNATINHGDARLDVELDLSNISAGRYLLSYRHARESWHRVPIVITN